MVSYFVLIVRKLYYWMLSMYDRGQDAVVHPERPGVDAAPGTCFDSVWFAGEKKEFPGKEKGKVKWI